MSAPQGYQTITRRPPDIEDYIDMLRRYRSLIIGPIFAGLVISVVVAFLWPDTYVSSAVMRITPQQIPEKLVPSVVTSQLAERLLQMQADILSRNTLSEIIQKPSLDLYKKDRAHLPMEDIIQDMRNKYIAISPIASADRRLATAFQISFMYPDRYKAQMVVRELVTRFMEQNVAVQKTQATLTASFLSDELRSAKEKLDQADAAIVKFKLENQGRLPEQTQANAQALQTYSLQVMNISQQINRDQQDKMILDNHLQALKNEQNYANANLETTGGPLVVRNEKLVNLAKQISQMRSDLAAAQRVYGDNYPDIQSRKAAVEQLEQEQAELEKQDLVQQSSSTQQPQRAANPQMAKTLRDLEADQKSTQAMILVKETEIEELTKQKGEVERQIVAYRKRIEEAPLSEQQYATLLTQQSLYKQQYEDLERRHSTAETAQNLDERKAGENLEVLDMANLPDKPVSPNRLEWAGTGSLVGLVCGLVLAAAKEVKNTSLKNLKDVRAYTNLPVLTSIPLLENALLLRRKRRLVYLAWSTAFLVGCAMMGGSMYYYMTST